MAINKKRWGWSTLSLLAAGGAATGFCFLAGPPGWAILIVGAVISLGSGYKAYQSTKKKKKSGDSSPSSSSFSGSPFTPPPNESETEESYKFANSAKSRSSPQHSPGRESAHHQNHFGVPPNKRSNWWCCLFPKLNSPSNEDSIEEKNGRYFSCCRRNSDSE